MVFKFALRIQLFCPYITGWKVIGPRDGASCPGMEKTHTVAYTCAFDGVAAPPPPAPEMTRGESREDLFFDLDWTGTFRGTAHMAFGENPKDKFMKRTLGIVKAYAEFSTYGGAWSLDAFSLNATVEHKVPSSPGSWQDAMKRFYEIDVTGIVKINYDEVGWCWLKSKSIDP